MIECGEFIASKLPIGERDIILFGGDFNTDALLADDYKEKNNIYEMLKDPVKYPIVN